MSSELQDEIFYKEIIGRENVAPVILLLYARGGELGVYIYIYI